MSAPSFNVADLPPKRSRRAFHDGELSTFSLPLKTITPIMGGGAEARKVDRHNPIRVASVRGQLRMWWRALNLHRFPNTSSLKEAEVNLWGGSQGRADGMKASSVSIHLSDVRSAVEDQSELGWKDKEIYVMWAAQSLGGGKPAERWKEGLLFTLHVSAPQGAELQVRDAVKAWILFGGYGGRARRGMGSLTINDPKVASAWLPQDASLDALKGLFESCPDWLEHSELNARETPSLRGASLALHHAYSNPREAWISVIHWLRDFRQGNPPNNQKLSAPFSERFARQGRSTPGCDRASISNWPEADKIRRLHDHNPKAFDHSSDRHNSTPVWPRAGFGLPLQFRFQKNRCNVHSHPNCHGGPHYKEPGNETLKINHSKKDRLASPLIIKPLAIGDGSSFVTCALWLNRALPPQTIAPKISKPNSQADWDELVAPGDQAQFKYLEVGQRAIKGKRLRTAFLTWLKEERSAQVFNL